MPSLADKHVLLLGADTPDGHAVAPVLSEAGARLALVAASADAASAFAVQRLARRLGATSQAIDVANEAAVRVMLRQISKQLGGLDTIIVCGVPDHAHVVALGKKELARAGGSGPLFVVGPPGDPHGVDAHAVRSGDDAAETSAAVILCLAAVPDNR